MGAARPRKNFRSALRVHRIPASRVVTIAIRPSFIEAGCEDHTSVFQKKQTIYFFARGWTDFRERAVICPTRLGKNQNRSPSESKMFYLGAVDRGCVESPTRFEAL
jgi:hypothetical protein